LLYVKDSRYSFTTWAESPAKPKQQAEDQKMSKHESMTTAQRQAINRVVRFYRERNRYTGCTSVRVELKPATYGTWITVRTRRSDCDQYSPRASACSQYGHLLITKRGAIRIYSAEHAHRSERSHVAFMLRGRVSK
jgi:hypothetical protein